MAERFAEYSSVYAKTEVKSKTFIYTWKISKFEHHLLSWKDPNYYLTTNSEALGENQKTLWSIQMHTNYYYCRNYKMHLRLHIKFYGIAAKINKDCMNTIFVNIIKNDGTELEIFKESRNMNSCQLLEFHAIDISRTEILKEKNTLLPNGDLTLKFKLVAAVGNLINQIRNQSDFFDFMPKNTGFENLLNNKKFSDVKIVIDDKEFHVNKCILAARSPVFAAMFEHNMAENIRNVVTIPDVKYEIMQEVLRFIYFGKVDNIEEVATDLLVAADKYEIEDLKIICEHTLINNLKKETVTNLLVFAEKYKANILKKSALEFFKFHDKEIIQNEQFKKNISSLLAVLPDIFESLIL